MRPYRPDRAVIEEHIRSNRQFSGLSNSTPLTEDSVAVLFALAAEARFRYCHSAGRWFAFDGSIWRPDQTGVVLEQIRLLARDAATAGERKDVALVGRSSFVRGVEALSRSDPRLAVTSASWNGDPLLLGTPNGTVDLRTGLLRPSQAEDGITKSARWAPSDTPDCPTWLKFMREVTQYDDHSLRMLKQWCGYCLTGLTTEHALLFIHGPGGNGKSVFLNTVTAVVGDYAKTAPMDTFTASRMEKHPADLAMLDGARIVTASETDVGHNWAEAKIKLLTGGDPITARHMRQNFFTFKPEFKLLICGNHPPRLATVDDALKRRLLIVPFNYQPERPDQELEGKLEAEGPGILRWMIEGSVDWRQHGLVRAPVVSDATAAYFAEQDILGQWIEDRCDCGPARWQGTAELYSSWKEYAASVGEDPGTTKAFSQSLGQRGLVNKRMATQRGFSGLALKR